MKANNLDKAKLISFLEKGKTIKEIAQLNGVNRATIHGRIKKWEINRRAIRFNELFFEEINSEIKAYWLGFIMADGCVSRTSSDKLVIKLAGKDKAHLEKWHKCISSRVKLCVNSDGTVASQLYSTKFCDDLEKLGCTQNKSLSLKFPKQLNPELVRHFVRGYFDGDGCASISNKKSSPQLRLTFIGTEDFLSQLKIILNLENKLFYNGKARRLEINGTRKSLKIVEWLYKDATIFLKRKREVCYSTL